MSLCTILTEKLSQFQSIFPSVIVTVFERIAVEYTYRMFSLFATQLTAEKSNLVDRQKLFLRAQLQTLHEISHQENKFGDLNCATKCTDIK